VEQTQPASNLSQHQHLNRLTSDDLQTDNFNSEYPNSLSQKSPLPSVRILPKAAHFSVRFAMQS
jgi:hypothetical protein